MGSTQKAAHSPSGGGLSHEEDIFQTWISIQTARFSKESPLNISKYRRPTLTRPPLPYSKPLTSSLVLPQQTEEAVSLCRVRGNEATAPAGSSATFCSAETVTPRLLQGASDPAGRRRPGTRVRSQVRAWTGRRGESRRELQQTARLTVQVSFLC